MIAQTAKGDRAAFDALYEASSARLHALCLSLLKTRPEAEDVLAEVYIRVWKDAARYVPDEASPTAWLTTIARNAALDRLRARIDGGTGRGLVQQKAASQPDALRAAYLEGADLAELARREGKPVAELRNDLRRSLLGMVNGKTAGLPADTPLSAEQQDDLLAAELALGLLPQDEAQKAVARLSEDAAFARSLRQWQERLAGLATELTPVMAPARARQRIREALGHGAPMLSEDPAERRPWWRGPAGAALVLLALAVIVAAALTQ